MARQRIIIAIGEALLVDRPEGVEPGGLALQMAIQATRFGHRGVPISRIGQDALADELVRLLRERSIDLAHLQTDPDLSTGRLVVRRIGPSEERRLDDRAAFDNLQWDFDLEDAAQRADVAIFGALANRGGQARSVVDRFLAGCLSALRVIDLTNRDERRELEWASLASLMEAVDVVIVDEPALRDLVPAAGGDGDDAVRALLRRSSAGVAIALHAGAPPQVHHAEGRSAGSKPYDRELHGPLIMGLIHAMIGGRDFPEAIALAEHAAAFSRDHADEPLPEVML